MFLSNFIMTSQEVEVEAEADDVDSGDGWNSTRSSGRRSDDDNDSSTSDYSDWAQDKTTTVLQPPQRRSRRKVRAPKYRQSDGEEQESASAREDDDSETEIDEQVGDFSFRPPQAHALLFTMTSCTFSMATMLRQTTKKKLKLMKQLKLQNLLQSNAEDDACRESNSRCASYSLSCILYNHVRLYMQVL